MKSKTNSLKPARSKTAKRKGSSAPCRGSAASSFGSDTLLEMWMEKQPARWAAHQIAAKRHPEIKTVGAAMDMIERIVDEAIMMDRHQRQRDAAQAMKDMPRKAQNDPSSATGAWRKDTNARRSM